MLSNQGRHKNSELKEGGCLTKLKLLQINGPRKVQTWLVLSQGDC